MEGQGAPVGSLELFCLVQRLRQIILRPHQGGLACSQQLQGACTSAWVRLQHMWQAGRSRGLPSAC